MSEDIEKLFKNKKLYEQALTHKSWINEHPRIRESNERLEFLGDAVLEFIVSYEIFRLFPKKEEGYLTALRANLVNTQNLSEIAKKLDLGKRLFLSKGELEMGGRENPSILADTFEALVGALFLDQGIKFTRKFIKENVLIHLEDKLKKPLKDAKSLLQEYVQAHNFLAPKYQVVDESGPDHAKKFTIEVLVNGVSWGRGVGKSKSEAAQKAARQALENFIKSKNIKIDKAQSLK